MKRSSAFLRSAALLLGLSFLVACAGRPGPPPERRVGASLRFAPDAVLQRLLDPRPATAGLSWLGGDVAASVAVADDRYVWIFGDSLLGRVADECPGAVRYCDRRLAVGALEHGMIPNSVGIMRREAGGGFSPLVKYWRTRDGVPGPIFEAADPEEFLWPLALVYVEDQLLIAANRHTRESGLYALGNLFLQVHNPHDPPDAWTYTRHPVPNVVTYREDAVPLTWTTALVRVGDWIYVVGSDGVGGAARMVLARFRAEALGQPSWSPAFEYLLDASAGPGAAARTTWSREFDRGLLHTVRGLAGTSEGVFEVDERWGWYTFQIAPLSYDIHMYSAPIIEGPWTDRGPVYRIPEPWSTQRVACGSAAGCPLRFGAYAAKSHPELAGMRSMQFVLTYNVNVSDGSGNAAKRAAEQVHGFYVPQVIGGSASR